MKTIKLPKDDENICLHCKHRITTEGCRTKPDGYEYWITDCRCELDSVRGVNKGHRKDCKRFLYDIGEEK